MPSSDAEILEAFSLVAGDRFASEAAREQFFNLNREALAGLSPVLLTDAVRHRLLDSPNNAHFLKPTQPQHTPGSVDAIDASFRSRGGGGGGLGGGVWGGTPTQQNHASQPARTPQPRGPMTLDQLDQAFNAHQAAVRATHTGLGGRAKK